MHRTANISLVLTKSSSLEQFADPQIAVSYGGFYQQLASQLLRGVHRETVISELSDSLVKLAEHAHAFRQMATVHDISQVLLRIPSPQCEAVGRYYQALCVHRFGSGDVARAARLIESVAESAPPKYRARALISLGANSYRKGDNQSALARYREASRFVSVSNVYDPYTMFQEQRMFAVIGSDEGNHRGAVALLENLFPLARTMRSSLPHVYYDYMNSLAVELGEVGRLEEAKSVSRIVLASPFATAYPEWRETGNEIDIKGWRASRSVVGFTRIPEASNIVRLPASDSLDQRSFIEPDAPGSRATVLSMQQWKKKMAKQSNGDPQGEKKPKTDPEKEARIKELEKLSERELLLRMMEKMGDERVSGKQLLRALIILEDLETKKNPGA